MDDEIRKAAYKKWEDEGRPEGQHERHWQEAEAAVLGNSTGTPQTWSSDHSGGVTPLSETDSDAVPSAKPGNFKPGELTSENK
jgi:hypothetical protein